MKSEPIETHRYDVGVGAASMKHQRLLAQNSAFTFRMYEARPYCKGGSNLSLGGWRETVKPSADLEKRNKRKNKMSAISLARIRLFIS